MVAKYPKSLQDIIEGDVIGSGYHSLVKQLQNRIENVKRSTTPKIERVAQRILTQMKSLQSKEQRSRTPMGVSSGM